MSALSYGGHDLSEHVAAELVEPAGHALSPRALSVPGRPGAVLLGCSRGIAAEFSFFLAVPVMFGASLLKLIKMKIAFSLATASVLIVGMIVAFIVSVFAIRFLMGYIRKHDFKAFGVYRIALGILVFAYFFFMK